MMRIVEKIKASFKRGKTTTKAEKKPTTGGSEGKTTEATGQEEAKG
jgi:hypothetical protein